MLNIIFERKENLDHFYNVIEERVALYSKRTQETKRAMKAYSRLNELPDKFSIFIMFDAEINFIANSTILSIIQELLQKNEIYNISEKIDWHNEIKMKFLENISKNKSCLSELDLNEYLPLFDAVFTLDENLQRKLICKFLEKNGENIIRNTFIQILIFDLNYTQKIVEELRVFLLSELSESRNS
ncbi:MAG: hypothetical protein ACFFDW_04810 [Candidatus Thorarchaeota archaeon]